jgi:glycosyltransferase involved in cell wall biosynthesis
VVLTYDPAQPSFRYRIQPLASALEESGWNVRVERIPRKRYLLRIWARRAPLREADVVLVHKIKLIPLEARLLATLCRRLVLDLDDAVHLRRPRRPGEAPGESAWRLAKFGSTCRSMDLVVACNQMIAAVAAPYARRLEVLPTPLDPQVGSADARDKAGAPTVVWVGMPENLAYLDLVRPALARLASRHGLRLRVVCSEFPEWKDVPIERVTWSAESESGALETAHIGIMPLSDDAWAEGKCAFKLLQYMAWGLPCVASPVGANSQAVIHGTTGFLARTLDEWERSLGSLIRDRESCAAMGKAGLEHLRLHYGVGAYVARYRELLWGLPDRRRR